MICIVGYFINPALTLAPPLTLKYVGEKTIENEIESVSKKRHSHRMHEGTILTIHN